MCVAALVNRRTQAVGGMVALLLSTFLINVLEAFISFFRAIRFLCLLCYYRPVEILQLGNPSWTHIAVLTGIAVVSWVIGCGLFMRKDNPVA